MKKIAVITGASSGMGRRFAETVDSFGRFDEVWVIARHEKALEELPGVVSAEVSHENGTAVVTMSAPVDDATLKKAVEDQGYQVVG